MKTYATSTLFTGTKNPDGSAIIVTVTSESSGREYRVDLTHGRCSCPAWKFTSGTRKVCKHLKSLGYSDVVYYMELAEPAKFVTKIADMEVL